MDSGSFEMDSVVSETTFVFHSVVYLEYYSDAVYGYNVAGRVWVCSWLWAKKNKKNKKGYFSPPCKQLATSHACTINGHLIGNNHFYLSKFKIGSYPWNRQLLVEPSGNIASMLEDVLDQCLQELVYTSAVLVTTVGC